jgi:hypothetical protein
VRAMAYRGYGCGGGGCRIGYNVREQHTTHRITGNIKHPTLQNTA